MAYIKVDYNKFNYAAGEIETYIKRHRSGMSSIDAEMVGLSSSWQGDDYLAVKKQWNEMYGSDSTSAHMVQALTNYANYLRGAGKAYQDAQARAFDRAGRLPQW